MRACFFMDNGETMRSYCKRNGIAYASVVNRIENGMTVEEAVADAKKTSGKGVGRNNCKYVLKNGKTLRQMCFDTGVCTTSCYLLVIYKGYTPDEAFAKVYRNKYKADLSQPLSTF